MAKLSQKQARRLTFVASKMALAYDQNERMALLTELLDEFGIDADLRTDSIDSAKRHLAYTAQQRRKAQRAAEAEQAELYKRLDDARAKRDELLDQLTQRLAMSAGTEQPTATPEPAPTVEDAPQYALPTKRMEKAVAAFDDLTDGEQVDQLRAMGW